MAQHLATEQKVHIYRAPLEPATSLWNDRRLLRADCCKKRRWAKYLLIQVYYDGFRIWCKPGHGCKTQKGNV